MSGAKIMTDMQEIKKMSDKDLTSLVEEKRTEMQKSRFNAAERNVKATRAAKKEIARALTELTARTKAVKADAK